MESMRLTLQLEKKCFPLPLCVEWLSKDKWKLLSPFEYHWYVEGELRKVVNVKEGFITDFASKPPFVYSLIGSPTDEGGPAYVVHDNMCAHIGWDRREADYVFLCALRDCGMKYLKRMVIYVSVRVWSWF